MSEGGYRGGKPASEVGPPSRSIKVTPRPDDRIQEMVADPAGYFRRAREHRIAEARSEREAKSAADDMTAHYRNEWRRARTQFKRASINYFWWVVVHAITVPAHKVK